MKTYKCILLLICSAFLLTTTKASAQTTIVGNVFAEVVASSNFSSDITTELSIDSVNIATSIIFGKITIKTNNVSSCDIVVNTINSSIDNHTPKKNIRTFNLTGIKQDLYTIVLAYN